VKLADIGFDLYPAVTANPVDHADKGFSISNVAVDMGFNCWAILQSMLVNPAQYLLLDGRPNPFLKLEGFNRIKMGSDAGAFDKCAHSEGFSAHNLAGTINPKKRRRAAQYIDNRTLSPVPLGE